MSKYLLVTLVLLVAISIWRHKQAQKTVARRTAHAAPRAAARPAVAAPMVRCAHCGVHLPQTEAIASDAVHYCSPAHRRLGPQSPQRPQ